jgi:flagellar biosynthesis regulator FlaF
MLNLVDTHKKLALSSSNNSSNISLVKSKTLVKSNETTSPKGLSKKFKNFPSNKEREFLNYFNNVDGLIKDKEIKYIRFVGKKLLSNGEINLIINERIREFEGNLMIKRKLDINRHSFETDVEKCTVDRKNQYLVKPTFDFNQNDKFFKTRHYFNVFLKNMTKVLINNRAEKRLGKLKEMIVKNNIRTPSDYEEFVEKDWLNQFNRDSDSGEDNLQLKFIAPRAVSRGEVYLSYDYNLDSLKQNIQHENNINLDELREYQSLEKSDIEIIGYKGKIIIFLVKFNFYLLIEFKSPGMTLYEINTSDKIMRTCAENEQAIRGERGDSEMAFDKIINLLEMPESYKQHIHTKIDTLLFNNPSFKKFVSFNNFTENSIDYNLQPRTIDHKEDIHFNYSNELYSKLPLSIYENLPIREIENNCKKIYNKILFILFLGLVGDMSLDFIPKKLKEADERDLYIGKKEKVDEDNYIFELMKDDENKLLNEFEKDDEGIRNVRELNKDEVYNAKTREKIQLENYLQNQKKKWMATVPTVSEFYNSGVNNANNKFIL